MVKGERRYLVEGDIVLPVQSVPGEDILKREGILVGEDILAGEDNLKKRV